MELFLLPILFWFWLPLGLLLIFVLFLVILGLIRSHHQMLERHRVTKPMIKNKTLASHQLSDEIRRRREAHAQEMRPASLKHDVDKSKESE